MTWQHANAIHFIAIEMAPNDVIQIHRVSIRSKTKKSVWSERPHIMRINFQVMNAAPIQFERFLFFTSFFIRLCLWTDNIHIYLVDAWKACGKKKNQMHYSDPNDNNASGLTFIFYGEKLDFYHGLSFENQRQKHSQRQPHGMQNQQLV